MSSSTTRRARPTSRAPPRRPGITWSGWWTRAAAGASRSRRDRALGARLARPLRVCVAADHVLLALDALDLAPLGAAAAQVARVGPLRDHSLQARLAGGVQERRAVALDVVGVAHRSGRRQELAEERLAVGEREAAEIPPEEGQAVVEVRRRRHPGGHARDLAHQVHAALQALEIGRAAC